MKIQNVITEPFTLHHVQVQSKKSLFTLVAEHVVERMPEVDAHELYKNLMSREKLGSTALGGGVAIPHCRVSGLTRPIGMLITLEKPVDFDAIDNQWVNLIFILIAPLHEHEQHLGLLRDIAVLLSHTSHHQYLTTAQSTPDLHMRFQSLEIKTESYSPVTA
ncbi:MAG: PTS sugar transporter subunit IIA [Pseudomonadota bacterium]